LLKAKILKNEGVKLTIYKDTAGIFTVGPGVALESAPGKLFSMEKINDILFKAGAKPLSHDDYFRMLEGNFPYYRLDVHAPARMLNDSVDTRLPEMEAYADAKGIDLGKLPQPVQLALADLYYNGGGGLILGEGSPSATGALRDGDWGKLIFEIVYNSNGGANPVWGVDKRRFDSATGIYDSLTVEEQKTAKARYEKLRALPENQAVVKRVKGRLDEARKAEKIGVPDMELREPGEKVHVNSYVRAGQVLVSDYERGYPHK
jgi:GH24 family phage-related lysozyme (muramidase)